MRRGARLPIEGDQQDGPFECPLVLLAESFVRSVHCLDEHFPQGQRRRDSDWWDLLTPDAPRAGLERV